MQLIQALSSLALVGMACASTDIIMAIAYSKEYFQGDSQVIYPPGGDCVAVHGDLYDKIYSIEVTNGVRCDLFTGSDCSGTHVEFTENASSFGGSHSFRSVRCIHL